MAGKQRVAVVSGAAKGIGAATAKALAEDGFCVAVLAHTSKEAAAETVKSIQQNGGTAKAYFLDVTDSKAVNETVAAIQKELGTIAVLVNNAGISEQKLFTDITDADWHRMLSVHLDGAFYLSRAVLGQMIHEKYGRIVNITSMWGQTGGSCEVHYSAAKAGLIGLTKALAKEVAPSGITVNAVSPGAIETDMMRMLGADVCTTVAEETPIARLGAPFEVAEAVRFLVSDKAAYITGQILGVNGGSVI